MSESIHKVNFGYLSFYRKKLGFLWSLPVILWRLPVNLRRLPVILGRLRRNLRYFGDDVIIVVVFFCRLKFNHYICGAKINEGMKIVILDGYSANPGDLSWQGLEEMGTVTVYDRTKAEETVARAAEAEIVLTNKVVIDREVMAKLPRLKYIGVLATGYNVVDIKAAHERGITVTNVPAYSTESVAQMVFAHLLTVTNRTEYYTIENRHGRWSEAPDFCYWDFPHMELAGKIFGIVGFGNIGQRVAQIALAFGMKVKALTSKETLPAGIEKASQEELLTTADVLSLHCPLTESTLHLINNNTLAQMKPTAILINTGRGSLVDDQAVADALAEGRLAAFCADVLTEEPPKAERTAAGDLRIKNPLLSQPNAYTTPHIAWASKEARIRLIQVATDNIKSFLNGKPKNVV